MGKVVRTPIAPDRHYFKWGVKPPAVERDEDDLWLDDFAAVLGVPGWEVEQLVDELCYLLNAGVRMDRVLKAVQQLRGK